MQNRIFWVAGALVILLTIVYLLNTGQIKTPTPSPKAITPPQAFTPTSATPLKRLTLNLTQVSNSTESGKAILEEVGGKVQVTLSLTGAPKGAAQPAHVHAGGCPGVGTVKYPLTTALDGRSETILSVSLDQLKKELPLAINIHKSQPEAKVYVSCGDLKF